MQNTARQPVHTFYGGAHLFEADSAGKMGALARQALQRFGGDPARFAAVFGIPDELAQAVFDRVAKKLADEPVEDLRIDFEDGYGARPEAEEDRDALRAAEELSRGAREGTLPPFTGIRIKPLTETSGARGIRTLNLFLTALLKSGRLPQNFAITLPKVETPGEVTQLADRLTAIESGHGLGAGTLKLELMIESPRAILDASGCVALPDLIRAAAGRCRGAHFGAFDYTAALGIAADSQSMDHTACDFARNVMQVALAGTDVTLSDGATNVLPIPPHKGAALTPDQLDENRSVVQRAWRLHYGQVTRSLERGFYQGWDLHPAQLPARYAAVYTFYLRSLPSAAARLRNFIAKAAQATTVGGVFDDAATGRGLLNFFARAMDCGALSEAEAGAQSGLTASQLRSKTWRQAE